MREDQNGKSPLRRLEETLYRKDATEEKDGRSHLRPHDIEKHSGWAEEPIQNTETESMAAPVKTKSFALLFFYASIAFFAVATLIALFVMLGGTNLISTRNVDITVTGPVSIEAGEEVQLEIAIYNKNSVDLESTDLLIEYPEGTRVAGDIEEVLPRTRTSLGVIPKGGIVKESVRAVFFGQEGEEKKVRIALEYRVPDSNAIFVAEETFTVVVSSSPVRISAEGVTEVSSGQEFALEVTVSSNASERVGNVLVAVDYPFGFSFLDATPKPTYGNDTWVLGDLPSGSERTIIIRGVLEGQDGEEKIFRVVSGTPKEKDEREIGVAFGTLLHDVAVTRPLLALQVLLNGRPGKEHILGADEEVTAEISWVNNLPIKISNAKIEVTLVGDALDTASVSPIRGFYQSFNRTVVWDGTTAPELVELEPGERGAVSVRFKPRELVLSGGTLIKEPLITLTATAEGTRVGESGSEQVQSSVQHLLKVETNVSLSQRALYYAGSFANTGPLPPKVGEETTYTILWNVVNTASDVSRGKVRATLPPHIRWIGEKSPGNETLTFSESDRSVVWDLGSISAGAGIGASPREVSFRVGFRPSLSQVGDVPTLVNESVFSGFDAFTETTIAATARSVNTQLSSDPQFTAGEGRVVE
ncbi:MAG: hypothetical protein HY457_02250 [Parcubacteria group bacterium]|nr:hypothetical protein [Parcubacteria group bacterium]